MRVASTTSVFSQPSAPLLSFHWREPGTPDTIKCGWIDSLLVWMAKRHLCFETLSIPFYAPALTCDQTLVNLVHAAQYYLTDMIRLRQARHAADVNNGASSFLSSDDHTCTPSVVPTNTYASFSHKCTAQALIDPTSLGTRLPGVTLFDVFFAVIDDVSRIFEVQDADASLALVQKISSVYLRWHCSLLVSCDR